MTNTIYPTTFLEKSIIKNTPQKPFLEKSIIKNTPQKTFLEKSIIKNTPQKPFLEKSIIIKPTYFLKYNDNTIHIESLPTTIIELRKIIKSKYSVTDFYILHNTKLLTDINYIKNGDILEVYHRLNGGNPLTKLLDKSFGPILDPLKKMLVGIVDIAIVIGELFALIPKIIQVVITIFKPDKLMNDIIYGTTIGINNMISALMDKLSFSTEKTMDEKNAEDDGSGGIFGIDDSSKSICTSPTWINLIILVLCPPLALYIHLGRAINGFAGFIYLLFMVIVCSGMTYYMYYFPGFLFAALHVLC